jgi:Putative restriction endonuclease
MATDTQATKTGVRPYRITVEQYLAMIDANILPDGVHAELLGGVLIEKMTKNPPHSLVILRLSKIFHRILPESWLISEEKPVKLGRFWYPEPDIAIVRGPDELYEKRAPKAAELGLLIEVADSSYAIDRGKKWRRYASSCVASYWIVNLQKRRIEVYGDPSGRGRAASYRQVTFFGEGEEVAIRLDGQEIGRIAVGDILPRP